MRQHVRILALAGVLICGFQLTADEPLFRRRVINADSTYCASTVLDVNGDGKLDIVSGGLWYESPSWQPHFLRDVEEIRGRFDDYSSLPLDVNSDGLTDLVSANYRSESIYWVQNPGPNSPEGKAWTRHVVDTSGSMETARLYDIDDDGRMDILPNGTKFAAWWDLQPGVLPKWQRYELPEELAGHGIGVGDINGDGRQDIVGARGWAEAPEDRRNERWMFHPEFSLGKDASIPIFVKDVDADGDNDLIWGRGHHFGLYWMEQERSENGGRTWIRHAIDTSWSQPHSLLWADLNGDGAGELIAGSRYMGHDGKDTGEYDPLTVCTYRFQLKTHTWQRLQISAGHDVGLGLDPKVADLDADGDMDLVCPGRSGLYVLENLLHNLDNTEPDPVSAAVAADTYDHGNVMIVRDQTGKMQPITTPFQMGQRRSDILAGMNLAMGSLPDPSRRVPLNVEVISEEAAEGYVRRRITFASEANDRVPAWLLIPEGRTSKGPAMLCLHQTTGIGKGEPAGLGGLENLHYAHELAQQGFVCIVPDYPSFGDYAYDFLKQGAHYDSGSMKAIWNNIRAIDLLESLAEVDPDRIGCVGHSLGGHNTLFTAAFDPRIKAAVTSCGFTAFHDYYEGNLAGWTSDRYMPRIRDLYGNDPNKMPFDFHEVLAAIAPRSIFINAPVSDNNFEVGGVKKVVAEATKAQQIYGAVAGDITVRYPKCDHDFPDEVRAEAWKWLAERLK